MANQQYVDADGLKKYSDLLNSHLKTNYAGKHIIDITSIVVSSEEITSEHFHSTGSVSGDAVKTVLGISELPSTEALFGAYQKHNPIIIQTGARGDYVINVDSVTYGNDKIRLSFATDVAVLNDGESAATYQCGFIDIALGDSPVISLVVDVYMNCSSQSLPDKQDKLTAGDNITIDDDGTISAVGGADIILLDQDILVEDEASVKTDTTGDYNESMLTLENNNEDTFYAFIGDDTKSITASDYFDKLSHSAGVYLTANGISVRFSLDNVDFQGETAITLQTSIVLPDCDYKGDNITCDYEIVLDFNAKKVKMNVIQWNDTPMYATKPILVRIEPSTETDSDTGHELNVLTLRCGNSYIMASNIYDWEKRGYRIDYYMESTEIDPDTEKPKRVLGYLTHASTADDYKENRVDLIGLSCDSMDSYGYYAHMSVYKFPGSGRIVYDTVTEKYVSGRCVDFNVQKKLTAGSGITIDKDGTISVTQNNESIHVVATYNEEQGVYSSNVLDDGKYVFDYITNGGVRIDVCRVKGDRKSYDTYYATTSPAVGDCVTDGKGNVIDFSILSRNELYAFGSKCVRDTLRDTEINTHIHIYVASSYNGGTKKWDRRAVYIEHDVEPASDDEITDMFNEIFS